MTHGFTTARCGQDRKKDPDDAPKKGVVNIIGIKWSTSSEWVVRMRRIIQQADLDAWIQYYNEERPHSGRYCYGKTPMETFLESLTLAKQKLLNGISPAA